MSQASSWKVSCTILWGLDIMRWNYELYFLFLKVLLVERMKSEFVPFLWHDDIDFYLLHNCSPLRRLGPWLSPFLSCFIAPYAAHSGPEVCGINWSRQFGRKLCHHFIEFFQSLDFDLVIFAFIYGQRLVVGFFCSTPIIIRGGVVAWRKSRKVKEVGWGGRLAQGYYYMTAAASKTAKALT